MKFAVGFALGALVTWFLGCLMWAPIADFWRIRFEYYKEKYTYSYGGSIDRGYITLCERGGELNIWFTDECDAP